MSEFQVKVNQEQVRQAVSLFEFVGGNSGDALRVAINKAGPKVRTMASKGVREEINVSASFLNELDSSGRKRLDFVRATRAKVSGAIRTQSRGLLLSHFEHGAKASLLGNIFTPDYPIKVKVKKGTGQIKTLEGDNDVYGEPFYIRLKNSKKVGIGMWRRNAGEKGGRVEILYGPSVSQVFRKIKDDISPQAGDELTDQLFSAMNYLLKKQHPKE
jgi:hypothetical protein